jgi:hypothetical protein
MATIFDAPNPNFATAVELTVIPRIEYPFSQFGDLTGMIETRDYVQNEVDFVPLPINTVGAAGFYLIEETTPQSTGNGLVLFSRRFGNVPTTFTSSGWESLTFPGYFATLAEDPLFRIPQATIAAIEIEHDFVFEADAADVSLAETPFKIVSAEKTSIDYLTTTSDPTFSDYETLISGNLSIVFKISEIRQAYGVGNIWEQKTFRVKAA